MILSQVVRDKCSYYNAGEYGSPYGSPAKTLSWGGAYGSATPHPTRSWLLGSIFHSPFNVKIHLFYVRDGRNYDLSEV